MLKITNEISIDEAELEYHFIKASGPGGQHVNKVATAVQLRFDVAHSASLPEDIRSRLRVIAGNRINKAGELIIEARRFRSQKRNQQDATVRLITLVRQAARKPRQRRKTRPSRRAKERRLESKRRQGRLKRMRQSPPEY